MYSHSELPSTQFSLSDRPAANPMAMETEVIIQSPAADFNVDSASTSPYITAPSSPQRFGTFFYSAPASPTRISAFYNDVNSAAATGGGSTSAVTEDDDTDFAFDFSGQLEKSLLSADELFDGGKIKPLKPPPRFQHENMSENSPKSPKSPKKLIKEALSPGYKKKEFDPFTAALEQTSRKENIQTNSRGRERSCNSSATSNSRHTGTRSLPPFRVSDLFFDPTNYQETSKNLSSWYKKWNLKDLLLFRSASESRATDKESMKKTNEDDMKNCSFRSMDSVGSVSSRRRKGPRISAHELHYTANRAASEEMKKRTYLPYKRVGLFGCLGFNPTVSDISNGLVSTASVSRP